MRQKAHVINRLLLIVIVATLLVTNVLTVTNMDFHRSVFNSISKLPLGALLTNAPMTIQGSLEREKLALEDHVRSLSRNAQLNQAKLEKSRVLSKRIAKRTARNVLENVASVPRRAIPYLGVAALIAATLADVQAGCETIHDIEEILVTLKEEKSDIGKDVCGLKVPDSTEILKDIRTVLNEKTESIKKDTSKSAEEFYDALGGTLHQILD